MTEIFNNAYNQANQILDGSGLSSVVYRQKGGRGYPQQGDLGNFLLGLLENKEKHNEEAFQKGVRNTEWFKEFVQEHGEEPNLNTPHYNYRKAWAAGVRPDHRSKYDGKLHWGSLNPETGEMLKSEDHPTAWKQHFMELYNVDPDSLDAETVKVLREKKKRIPQPKGRGFYQQGDFTKGMFSERKAGGGLSNLRESIDINGQPHKLAWIRPGEASVLKAMGGSGKPGPMGIPSYQWGDYPDELYEDQPESALMSDDKSGSTDTSNYVPDTVGPHGYSWDWMPSGSTWRYDYSIDPKAEGPGLGYSDFVPPSAATSETDWYFKKTAENLAKRAGEAASGWDEDDVNKYKAQLRAFGQHKYNKDPLMTSDFDREAARVLDRMAVDYGLPVWGIGMHYRDDLGANEPLHYWQYSDSEDEYGNKIPGGLTLSNRGYYGGKDSPFAKGLASLVGTLFIPGYNLIEYFSGKINKGFGKANPDDPRYWPKPKRSLQDARQAVLNEYSDKKEGIEKGFVASGKELIDMYKLGSDDTATKEGGGEPGRGEGLDFKADPESKVKDTGPEPEKDRIATYDDFWKSDDPSAELYQGNYEEYPQKLKKLPPVKKDLTEPEEKEPTGMAALLAKRPKATSREYSNVHLGELLNQIYGKNLGQSMLG